MRHSVLRWAYRVLLRIVPSDLRLSHAVEMEQLFADTLDIEIRHRGWFGRVYVFWGAVVDVLSWSISGWPDAGSPLRCRDGRSGLFRGLFTALHQDLRSSVRSLRQAPGFTTIAVLTLALGLGGSIAIFSVVDAVLLRPLPFPEPGQLYTVWETNLERGRRQSWVAPPTFTDWREQAQSFSEMSAMSSGSVTLTGGATPERISALWASPNIFELMGVAMLEGGAFPPEAEQPDGGSWVVVSYGFWQRWLGGESAAVGGTLLLDDEMFTVGGVLPREFWFPETADLWLPLTFAPDQLTEGMRGARYLQVIARLRPGLHVDRARAEMATIADALAENHPNNTGWGVSVVGLQENMVVEFRRSLTLLLLATILVLVIACVNVVNLVLARSSDRSRERAVRSALGATRLRLFEQYLVEHILLGMLGGVIGVAAAFWAIAPLVRLAPVEIPRIEEVALDGRVLLVSLVLSAVVGLMLGLVSTWSGVGSDPSLTLRSAQVGGGPARHRVRKLLIVAEVGLSLLLMIGAGLLTRSFVRLQRVDPGFSVTGLTTVSLSLPSSRYASGQLQATLYRELLERISSRREILSAGATTNLPLSGSAMRFGFSIDDRPDASLSEQLAAEYHAVTPGYFQTMGIALRSGRALGWHDDANGAPVVIINETMARRYWPNEDPLGKKISVVSQSGPTSREIVGVLADVRHAGLAAAPRVEVYVPMSQDPWAFVTLVLRGTEGAQIAQLVRTELAFLDSGLPLGAVLPIERFVLRWLAPLRFQLVLAGIFAVVALVLAALGIYGVVSYLVSLRTNEIGVRMALGALSTHVFGSVVGQGAWLAGAGIAIGVVVAALTTRHMSTLLFEVAPADPMVFLTVPALVLVMAILACYVPARRATKVDPATTLREM